MNLRCLFLAVLPAAIATAARADEAVNKLMAGCEQAQRAAKLPLLRKLLTELQKLETQYQKENRAPALADVQVEIVRVKEWITDASRPVTGGTGPLPGEFKIIYQVGDAYVFGTWESGDLKMEPRGFSWKNDGPMAAVTHTRSLPGAFEAEISYTGTVYSFSLAEADYTKYVQMFFHPPADDGKHTLKIKRTAAGALTAELDRNPVTLQSNNGGRPDMIMRLCFHVGKGSRLFLHDLTIKEPVVKK